jgi:hypothetical protein
VPFTTTESDVMNASCNSNFSAPFRQRTPSGLFPTDAHNANAIAITIANDSRNASSVKRKEARLTWESSSELSLMGSWQSALS